ncbi:hypothetical protein [uncultured Methanomethylovorans sp.]|uniref:hypothetical protein n=1 Tax=uncultured Methanomethylovorans sp. TaxID=183759 RepID=UPI002AA5EA1F|nr:hypothetical protein [uncultured Methanomethylovorans sp.]
MELSIKIKRESEFYKGCIRFKVTVANESDYVITDVTLDFKIDETILHIVQHDKCSARNGQLQFVLGNIKRHNSKTFTVLFEPLTCTESTDIRCLVTYADHEENMNSTFMEPKRDKRHLSNNGDRSGHKYRQAQGIHRKSSSQRQPYL